MPYHESFHLHGDLPEVWVKYQPSLLASDFCEREQSTVPRIACAALRRLVHKWGRSNKRADITAGMSLNNSLMVGFLVSQGQGELAAQIVNRHNQTNNDEE